jgi:two-component system, OmpR family, heavy metal sensor histidine kinase CusS
MRTAVVERITRLADFARSTATTLRVRLMVWNAGLIVVTALACFLGVREGLRQTLLSQMDHVLTADVKEISLDVAERHATADDIRSAAATKKPPHAAQLLDDLNRKESVHEYNGWFVEIRDQRGSRLWASDLTPSGMLSSNQAIHNMTPVSQNGFRTIEVRKPNSPGGALRIRVGAPMEVIDRDIASIDSVAMRGVALLLVAAPLAGYWLAGRAIRPLAAIIRTTGLLRPNRMDERLPNRQTDDELDQLSQTVNQFLDRIAVYLSQSNDLLANSAHELRTPLAAIRSTVEVALGGSRTPQEYEELLTEVIDECGSLERLVNQLLLLAETDTERLRTRSEPLDLSFLVERCAEMFSAAAEARHVTLRMAILPGIEVVGFANHLRQVVNNLLDNALKFTPPGGTISVEVVRESDTAAILRVRDTGCGIPAADLPRIFERFFRGDKSRQRLQETTGTGLGLSICQAIVAAHGGQILVDSREGMGTTMTVRLPAIQETAAPSSPRETSETIVTLAGGPVSG